MTARTRHKAGTLNQGARVGVPRIVRTLRAVMDCYRWVRPLLFRFDPRVDSHPHLAAAARAAGRFTPAGPCTFLALSIEDPRSASFRSRPLIPESDRPARRLQQRPRDAVIDQYRVRFLEVGSVSRHPSAGNPERPRLFRLFRSMNPSASSRCAERRLRGRGEALVGTAPQRFARHRSGRDRHRRLLRPRP